MRVVELEYLTFDGFCDWWTGDDEGSALTRVYGPSFGDENGELCNKIIEKERIPTAMVFGGDTDISVQRFNDENGVHQFILPVVNGDLVVSHTYEQLVTILREVIDEENRAKGIAT